MGYESGPHTGQGMGSGPVYGRGNAPTNPWIDSDYVGGIPSAQPAHYFDQWSAKNPTRYGELAHLPRPVQGGIVDRFLGFVVAAPVIPRAIPGQWQITTQIGFGASSTENIALRAPRMSEGSGLKAIGSMIANGYGG